MTFKTPNYLKDQLLAGDFLDAVLGAEGETINVHRAVLAGCSPLIYRCFKEADAQNRMPISKY